MRIVHITNAGGYGRVQSGGAERAVAELATALSNSFGWDEHVIAPPELFAAHPFGDAVETHPMPLSEFSVVNAIRGGGQITALVKRLNPDVVVGHLLRGTLVGLTAASRCNTKRVSVLHNSLSDYVKEPGHRPVKHAVNRIAFRFVSRRYVDLHIAISAANRDDLVTKEHVPQGKVLTIHNWVSPAFSQGVADGRTAWRTSHDLAEEDRVILIAGRLEEQKNQEAVIRLLPSLPNHTLLLAGEGSLSGEFTRLAQHLGVAARVRQLGFESDIAEVMAAADVVAVPSRFEGFGRTVIEALAVGTPVVATRLDAIAEVLQGAPVESYALCALDDDAAWTSALDRLSTTSIRGRTTGARVSEFIEKYYSLSGAAAAYDQAFRTLVADDLPGAGAK